MKRKRVISGRDGNEMLTITIEFRSLLYRMESQRVMDHVTDEIMRMFPSVPHLRVPMSRLTMK